MFEMDGVLFSVPRWTRGHEERSRWHEAPLLLRVKAEIHHTVLTVKSLQALRALTASSNLVLCCECVRLIS